MKEKWKRILLFAVIGISLSFFGGTAIAAETENTKDTIYEKSGAGEIYDHLDEDAKSLLQTANVNGASLDLTADGGSLFSALAVTLREKATAPMRVTALLLAVIILCRLCGGLTEGAFENISAMVGMLAAAGILVPQLISLIAQAERVINGSAAFLVGCVPAYTALLVAVGNGQTAVSTGYLTLAAGNTIALLASAVFVPLLNIFLALSVTATISDGGIEKVTDGIYRFVKWALVLTVTIFFTVMSLQTAIQSSADGAAAKAAKMVVSSAIPVIGGTISDSLGAIQGSVALVKTGVGAFGILAALAIFLPLLAQTLLFTLVCWISEIAADLFEIQAIGKFARAAGAVVKMISAVLASCFAVCITCASVLALTRGSL